MGLMDRVKQQASQLAEMGKEAGKAGQAKLEALQAKRRADALLADLGAIYYAERNGRTIPGSEARVDELVAELKKYEADYGPIGDEAGADFGGGDESAPADSSGAPNPTPESGSGSL